MIVKITNKKQKFPIGTIVQVAKDLGPRMPHFDNDFIGIVMYTYVERCGYESNEENFKKYCIKGEDNIGGAWYDEYQLTEIDIENGQEWADDILYGEDLCLE